MENELKDNLRWRMKAVRSEIADREDKNRKIAGLLAGADFFAKAKAILSYCSVGSEADTFGIHQIAFEKGKKIALPVTEKDFGLEFFILRQDSALKKGFMGIPEPAGTLRAEPEDFQLCLIPALACDRYGYRLGYGKGCYDRFLKDYRGTKVVLAFSDSIVDTVYPDKWDIQADYIVSDKGILEF